MSGENNCLYLLGDDDVGAVLVLFFGKFFFFRNEYNKIPF